MEDHGGGPESEFGPTFIEKLRFWSLFSSSTNADKLTGQTSRQAERDTTQTVIYCRGWGSETENKACIYRKEPILKLSASNTVIETEILVESCLLVALDGVLSVLSWKQEVGANLAEGTRTCVSLTAAAPIQEPPADEHAAPLPKCREELKQA